MLTRRLTLRNNGERLTIAGRAARRDVRRIAASPRRSVASASRCAPRPGGRRPIRQTSATRSRRAAAYRPAARRTTACRATPNRAAPCRAAASRPGSTPGSIARSAPARRVRRSCPRLANSATTTPMPSPALDGLAQRFPAGAADSRLSARARDDVRWLTAAYYARVTASYERLEAHLAPLTGSVSRRVLTATPPSPSHWRTTSAAIAPAMRELSAELAGLASPASSSSPIRGTRMRDRRRLRADGGRVTSREARRRRVPR